MIPVIICGGFGTKMWPLSRQHRPKHLISLIGEKSLFQLNYEALLLKFKPQEIYVSTNQDQVEIVRKQAPDIPHDNYILEPEMKNTGPAIGLIAATLFKKGLQDEPFMVIQVDNIREPVSEFIKTIETCEKLARERTEYITGGFKPKASTMGVDYLVKGERVTAENEVGIYKVKQFVWRTSEDKTEELIKADDILLHANHTCMTPKNYLEMYKKYRPDWHEPLLNIINGQDLALEFGKMKAGTQEEVTQLAHEAGESLVIELPFTWYDFGTFESLEEYLKLKNLYKPLENIVDLNGKNNFVRLDDPNKVIVMVGVDNLVVVDTGDALLITDKNATGNVGEALKEVKKRELALT